MSQLAQEAGGTRVHLGKVAGFPNVLKEFARTFADAP